MFRNILTATVGVWISMILIPGAGRSTPSTQIWIPSTDIQTTRSWHLGIDNYNTAFRKSANGAAQFPLDIGLTYGLFKLGKAEVEVGVDWFEPQDDPFMFNAKIGLPEGSYGKYFPAIAVGAYSIGTKKNVTDYNIVYGQAAKTFGIFPREERELA